MIGVHAAPPMVTKSNGGVMSVALGKNACVNMLLSGTASGVMGAAFLARQAGIAIALTLDIGGTSADVALVIDGQPQFGMGETIGDFPLFMPSVSVTSIGDGGGSIAWVDGFGVLKVGPESAGSAPGPACYGRGGDARHHHRRDGGLRLARPRAARLRHGKDGPPGARTRRSAACGAARPRRAADRGGDHPGRHLRHVRGGQQAVSRYGVDPRDFTLLPFGGAGPMLGCLLARNSAWGRVVIRVGPAW